jgi:hypothetical protein
MDLADEFINQSVKSAEVHQRTLYSWSSVRDESGRMRSLNYQLKPVLVPV